MKRFADSVARQKGIRPPAGYTKSRSICRAFLDQHAPKKAEGDPPGELGSKPASPAQMLFAEKIARERGIVILDETKASSAAMSAWIEAHLSTERGKSRRKTANKPAKPTAPKSPAPTKRSRMHKGDAVLAPPTPARPGNGRAHSRRGKSLDTSQGTTHKTSPGLHPEASGIR
jgi:DNA topoisomerase-3